MKKIIRLTESELHQIIENSVKRIIMMEDGEGSVAADGSGFIGFDTPAFTQVIKPGHNLGKKSTKKGKNQSDFTGETTDQRERGKGKSYSMGDKDNWK